MPGQENNATHAQLEQAPSGVRPPGDDHLDRLLLSALAEPWYKSFLRNLKEFIRPPKLPPLLVTSKPVAVKDIWGDYRYRKQGVGSSVVIHIGVVALLVTVGSSSTGRHAMRQAVNLIAPDLLPYIPDAKPKLEQMGGGGGGGDRSPLPPSKGRTPRPALRQFTPPMAV